MAFEIKFKIDWDNWGSAPTPIKVLIVLIVTLFLLLIISPDNLIRCLEWLRGLNIVK